MQKAITVSDIHLTARRGWGKVEEINRMGLVRGGALVIFYPF